MKTALALDLEASPKDSVMKLCDGWEHIALAQEHSCQVAVWSLG